MYFFFLAQRIKGFNPKVKFDFILLEANMLENTSVFKVGGQQRCPVELLDCPLCTVIDCAPSPPGDLTHGLMKSRLQGELSLTFSSNCHGKKPTNLISFFLFTSGAFDEGSDSPPAAVTR